MAVRSSIYVVKVGREPWAVDDETGEEIVGTLAPGFTFLTRPDTPATPHPSAPGQFHVLHADASVDAPANVHEVVAEKTERPWVSVGLPPWAWDFVYEAAWDEERTDPNTGWTYSVRHWDKIARVPPGVTVVETDRWPNVIRGQVP